MLGVVIATYGDDSWRERSKRAWESVRSQTIFTPVYALHLHVGSLGQTRNDAAVLLLDRYSGMGITHLVFLDADDELAPTFVEAMTVQWGGVDAPRTVFVPRIRNIDDGPSEMAYGLVDGRPIGCAIPLDLFTAVGGFDDWPFLEDMAFWLRAEQEFQATFVKVPKADYIVHNDSPVRRNPPNGSRASNLIASQIRRFGGSYRRFQEATT